jgi:hypothetical protein
MIKKLVSNALLSMVMDKKAREKFNAVQDDKRRKRDGLAPAERANNAPDQPAATANTTPAPTPGREPASAFSASPPRADDDDPEALIREALESAELELIEKRNKKPMTSERQALIDQAMAIHNSKSHILDELDPEHREKLTFMALKALDKNFGE